jgi:hypothetical protein
VNRGGTITVGIFAALLMVLVWERPAYAYVDPGSGGMLVQLLLGGVAGAAVLLRLFWHRILRLVGLRRPEGEDGR